MGGLTFDEADVVEYNALTDIATLFFDHNLFSGLEDIDAVSVPEPTGWLLLIQLFVVGSLLYGRARAKRNRRPCPA